jgi:hypothetical protein
MISELSCREYEAILRSDLGYFAERCFAELNPQAAFLTNGHIEVIAAKLAAVREGKIRRLIINLPPRHLKSLIASIAFPAWYLGHHPAAQILCVSYAQDLSDKLARDCRSIMMSPWYRRLFATRLAPHRHAVQEFITTRQGYRLATSTGGVLTGRGADIILIDDPSKPEEALSQARRDAVNEWYDHTLYSRLNDKHRGAIVIIMQRLHEDDLVGHVLGQEAWEVVSFSAIAEADEVHAIETIWGPQCFTRRRGEALHPAREPLVVLENIRRTIGEYNFAGQYQQSPAPLGGGLVKADWFKRYGEKERPERFDRGRAELGHRQQSHRAQRFQHLHDLGRPRQETLSPGAAASAARISRPQARGARAADPVQRHHGADRGQGLGHPADPGVDRRRLPRRHPLSADLRQNHAAARADRDDREWLCLPPGERLLARRIPARDNRLPQQQA